MCYMKEEDSGIPHTGPPSSVDTSRILITHIHCVGHKN